jgi:spermidine synthase
VWDYFVLAPYFTALPNPEQIKSVCMVGLAGGTAAKEYTAVYGPVPIRGLELDPEVVEVGRRFFDMNEENLSVTIQDGRYFLAGTDEEYDVIIGDAYRQPYIPFHLTTREFFSLAREHLNPGGVVLVNVGRTASDFRLVDTMASTMSQVFPSVLILDVPGVTNSLVIGTDQETTVDRVQARLGTITNEWLSYVAAQAIGRIRAFDGQGLVLTDDRAPVEHLTHLIVLRYLLQGE